MNNLTFSEKMTLETFRKIVDPKKGLTRAQVFYRQLVQHTFDEKTSIGRKNLKELYGVSGEREQVRIKAKLIRQTADKYFQFIGNPQLSETLFKELKKQQEDTRRRLKKEAVANSMMLYHATPLAKEDLDGGVLRGNTERSDFVLEKTFIGVCATPISNGAFAIKKVKNEYDFSCRGDNLIILTDNRLNGKKDNELLGYMHGHKITADDGFMPTVSLGGDIAGEWTTEKNVSIDFSEKITLNSLKEKGVHIFSISKKDKEFVKKLIAGKTHKEQAEALTKMAANPQKEYIGDDNKPRKVSVIDCLNQNSSNKDNEDIRIVEPAKEHYESYVKACQQMHAYLTDESINDPVGKRESAGFIFAQDKYQVSSQEDFKNKIVDFFKNKRKLNTSVHNQELNREKGPELFYFITKGNEIIGSINARPIKMDEFDRKNGIKSCEKWHELSPETGVRATTSTVILHQHKNKGYAGKAKEQLFNNLNKYGITEVVANVMADNIRSNKAQEKLVNKYGGFSSVCRDGELCGSRYVVSTDTSGNSKKLYKKREKPPQEKMRSGLRQTLKKAAKAASNSLPIFKVKQNNSKG